MKKIKEIWKEEWFNHEDCTEDTCIFTFIKNNMDKFKCDIAKSCEDGQRIWELQRIEHQLKRYRENLTGLREDINKNTEVMLTLIMLLKRLKAD